VVGREGRVSEGLFAFWRRGERRKKEELVKMIRFKCLFFFLFNSLKR